MKLKNSKGFRFFLRVKNIILVVLLLMLFAIIVLTLITRISGGTPSAFGYTLYRVSSGSMEPELMTGDVILSKSCDPESLVKGEIVTYISNNSKMNGTTITHRVVQPPFTKNGKRYIVTKGDANTYLDKDVSLSDIRGKYICKIEVLNSLYSFFITPWGLITIILLIILAFFNEIVILVKAVTGIGYNSEKKENLDDIIARYKNENGTESFSDTKKNSDNDIDSGG